MGRLIAYKGAPFSGIERVFKKYDKVFTKNTMPSLREYLKNNPNEEQVRVAVFTDTNYESKLKNECSAIHWEFRKVTKNKAPDISNMVETMKSTMNNYPIDIDLAIREFESSKLPITRGKNWNKESKRICLVDFENTLVIERKNGRYKSKDLILETSVILDGLALMRDYLSIIILSNEPYRNMGRIVEFLENNDIEIDNIYFKRENESEVDFKAKKLVELGENNNIMFAIDDDPDVCEMYRSEFGLTVFQCSDAIQMTRWVAKQSRR